ncbi:MAG: long-chain acyl-CoA synthetase [Actinomycetota bacterium]|jgi:long-chain acyl-CoA synthetase|nr:long-chain acyl-CoA synthetase [Actinomycetota bacterium]
MYPGEHAKTRWDEPAFIMANSGETVTFRQYDEASDRMAQLYRAQGLQHKDHVAFFFENNLRMLECEGGAERSGLYYTCINSYLAPDEVAYIINDSESKIVVTSAAKREVAMQLPALCPDVERWLMADIDGPDGPFESLIEARNEFPAEPIADQQLGAAMLYSSGTTGRPKGILRPLPLEDPTKPLPVMEFVRWMYRFREGLTYLSPAPLYHSAPQASVSAAMRFGGTSIIMEKFDPAQFLDLVAKHQVTHSQMVPTMFSRLLKLPKDVRDAADLSSLECIIHAAAPCPVPVKQEMIEWFGPIIVEYYGATEANGFTYCTSEEWLEHPGTVGKCILGELLILDEDGNPQPKGTPGTVWFKGATNFEYYNAPEKTAESRNKEGDASTVGDVGYVDDDGFLFLTDRKSYMIISGGVNIYPQETENLLITHPKVMDAAVLGVPNEDLGEEVKGVVQPMEGIEPGPELERELIAFCRENLAHYKCPRTIDFEAELPRLPTGKLYKRLLRDRYWEGHSTAIV